jgi:outer membrane protein assembly factor BamE (lipoprotein component of BamABCDE complex)
MTISRPFSIVAVMLSAVILSACSADVAQRGNLPEHAKLAEIHPGSTTKAQVTKLLGSPSSVGVFNDRSWYYISRKTEQTAFFKPDVLDQEVYVVSFNNAGIVDRIEHKTLKNGEAITPVARTTPAPGRELTFLEQILGNIGRFNSSSAGTAGPVGSNPTD